MSERISQSINYITDVVEINGLPYSPGVDLTNATGILAEEHGGTGAESLTYDIVAGRPFDTTANPGEAALISDYLAGIYSDVTVDLGDSGTAQTLDASQAGVFVSTLTDDCVFTLDGANVIPGRLTTVALDLTNDATAGRTVSFAGGTIVNPGGAVNRTTAAGARDLWFIHTYDGITWTVSIPQKNIS